ncbi:MAG: [Fe-Fe] hydrogenase large subunit C-terminal domain-containing protein [Eubacteriales bacterium]|nr:[Fe-Fe] hydrogenase large subunit C-terminal domain-containing protein [Eubacteriales bacterium]
MSNLTEVYEKAAAEAIRRELCRGLKNPQNQVDYEERRIECLTNPDKYPLVVRLENCHCKEGDCVSSCAFDAIYRDNQGAAIVDNEKCTGCSECISACSQGNIAPRKDIVPLFELLKNRETNPVYAIVAPAFVGQFSESVTPGMLRTTFKKMGFEGMVEVALFADILTLKEALEYQHYVKSEGDYMLTSCCCPMWVGMIRKVYSHIAPHMPPSVSPMVACGRSIKKLNPDAKVVFIGPCLAKKAEAKEEDIKDAVDLVLTFQETEELFYLIGIDPSKQEEDDRDHASFAGRIYARSGGVCEAVEKTSAYLNPLRELPFKSVNADGVAECKKVLTEIMSGDIKANFIEGMGCVGGCVGGPKRIIDKNDGKRFVEAYAKEAEYTTPVNNPYVIDMLHRLGYDSIESLVADDTIFLRKW